VSAIHLDGHATTPIAPEAIDAMLRQLAETGNPHAAHAAGQRAAAIVEEGRAAVAALIGAQPAELFFTSGATEANNLALLGLARSAVRAGLAARTVVTSPIEHPSVLGPVKMLEREGFRHVAVPVGPNGVIDLAALAVVPDALIVSVGLVNGELGTVQPIEQVAAIARSAGALVHCDGAQAVGRIPVDVFALDVDALSMSSHKMYGPAGIGALFVSSAAALRPEPLFAGGGQEGGLRPGTVPAVLVAGFAAAAKLASAKMADDAVHAELLRDAFLSRLTAENLCFKINALGPRVPGSLNIRFDGVEGDSLVDQVADRISIATGSACSSGKIEPSQVLTAIGLRRDEARASVRLYFDRYLNQGDVRVAAATIAAAVRRFSVVAGEVVQ
jgi:cysteine desulfurase